GFSGATADDSSGDVTSPGYHNDADVVFTYGRRGRGGSFQTTLQTVERYDVSRAELMTIHDRAAIDVAGTGTPTSFRVAQAATSSPLYQFGVVPDQTLSTTVDASQAHGDYATAHITSFTSATAADLGRALGRYTTLTLSYARRATRFSAGEPDFTSQDARVSLTRRLTRRASLHAGYGYEVGGSKALPGSATHDLDLGVGYGGAITSSQRLLFSFSSGSTLVNQGQAKIFGLSADASLTRLFGHTGSLRLGYRRGTQLLEGFAGPVMFDAVNTS